MFRFIHACGRGHVWIIFSSPLALLYMALKVTSTTSFAEPGGHVSIRFRMMTGEFSYISIGNVNMVFGGADRGRQHLMTSLRTPMFAQDMYDIGTCTRSVGVVLALYSQQGIEPDEQVRDTWQWHVMYLTRQMDLPDSQMAQMSRIINMYTPR